MGLTNTGKLIIPESAYGVCLTVSEQEGVEFERCPACQEVKELYSGFYFDPRQAKLTKSSKDCRKCCAIRTSKHRQNHSERYKNIQRNTRFKKLYNISLQDYETQLTFQDGKCAICGCTADSNRNKKEFFAVDHNHINNKVRGLLCSTCNVAIGWFEDNVESLSNAIKYLKEDGIWK